MPDLALLAVSVAEALVTRQRPETGRLAGLVLAGVLAGVFALAALGCALAAVWIEAMPQLGRAGAPTLVAGLLAGFSLAALAVVWRLRHARRPPPAPVASTEILLAEITRLTQAHTVPMLLAALAAGLTAGSRRR